MKIVEIINSFSLRGGAEVFLHSLAQELSKNNDNQILLISLFSPINDSFKDLSKDNVSIVTCDKKRGFDLKAAKKLRQYILSFNPDIVHTHLSCSLTMYLAFGFKKRSWRYIHTVHNVADKESTGIVSLINKRFIKKHIMEPVGISDSITESIKKKYKTTNVKTIYNGAALFSVAKYSFKERKYDFICVARFYEQKNHLLLLNAFKMFLSKHPDSTLALVGDGELKQNCIELCDKLSISNSVYFIGSVNNVDYYLNQSKVFILTSLFEGNPISILEAMSVGLTIVSSNVGGVPDVVSNNRNGFLFESNNIVQLVECMCSALDERNWIIAHNNNIRDAQKYSICNCCAEYYAFFNKKDEEQYHENNK